jgi:hypothetical protein
MDELMIVNTSDDFEARTWRVYVTTEGVQFITDDGCNNQSVCLQMTRDEARRISVALLAATERGPDPILSDLCRAGRHAACSGHGERPGCGCTDTSHAAPA